MLSQKAVEENHTVRLNAHAEDIAELYRRLMEGDLALGKRLDELGDKHDVGWECLAKKIIPLEKHIEELFEGTECLAGHIIELRKRIEQLEKQLEKEE